MKRQQAFMGNEKMLKGNLHCHTTRSDGTVTPEEVVRAYYERGYDFLAITDHHLYNYKNYAPEVPITIIPGMEIGCDIKDDDCLLNFDTLCLGRAKEDGNGFEQDEYRRVYPESEAQLQEQHFDYVHEKNNITICCHPDLSMTPARYLLNQKGHIAMEIWNSCSAFYFGVNENAAYWDEVLGQGKCLYGVAVDDNHHRHEIGMGWVMVRAENNTDSILEAIKEGKFYSSCGPEIYDFYVEGNTAVVTCSPVAKIRATSNNCPLEHFVSKEGNLTKAKFKLHPYWKRKNPYVRITVTDKNGRCAWTNPIFLGEENFK